MIEFLYSIDVAIFFFINHTIANPILDWIMPFLTDLNKQKPILIAAGVWMLYVIWKGGQTGRITVGILIITIIFSDQLNSSFIKEIFGRIRPCRTLDGVRMLVDCGGGLSFPSTHAVNNFAGATVISHFYSKQKWYWYTFAVLVALSRPYVGVHYPSDILAGGILGFGIGLTSVGLWKIVNSKLKNIHSNNNSNSL
ncbi:MAG: phosphatase PAP2 family protein [Bacteroidota bacterium]